MGQQSINTRYGIHIEAVITKSVLTIMKRKNELWKDCLKHSSNEQIRSRFNKYRDCRRVLRDAENNYLNGKIDMTGDPKGA